MASLKVFAMLAWPLTSGAVPQIVAGLPCMKATAPGGALPSCPVTVAVNAMDWLRLAGLALDVRTVVVTWLTAWVSAARPGWKLASPL